MLINRQVRNQNGNIYTIVAIKGDRAIVVNEKEFVVIRGLSNFFKTGSRDSGTYIPFFSTEDSPEMLQEALEELNKE